MSFWPQAPFARQKNNERRRSAAALGEQDYAGERIELGLRMIQTRS